VSPPASDFVHRGILSSLRCYMAEIQTLFVQESPLFVRPRTACHPPVHAALMLRRGNP
jgi:hypothetical protein